MDFFVWLESTAPATWVRESSSLWAYPTVLFLHTFGMATVAGLNTAIDLRLLGFGKEMPVSPLVKLFPLMWVGFWINAFSGTLLLIADATTKFTSPVFYIKLLFITLAVINLRALRSKVFRDPLIDKVPITSTGRFLAITSIIFWLGAITSGRLMAYLGPVSGLSLK